MAIRIAQAHVRRFIRFILVGGINTCFSFVIYALLLLLGAHYAFAVLIANIAGIAFNFKTTSRFVFQRNDSRLIFRFIAAYGLSYVLGVFCIRILLSWGVNRFLAGAITAVPMAGISFILLSLFVFRLGKDRSGPRITRETA